GAVRDLLLREEDETLFLQDIDLVVDGFHQTAEAEAGVQLARLLQAFYPQARLSVHGSFQTAALLWHRDPVLGSLWVDIATARTEFYPYPAANPVVEASSIRQDLYRRDFTINALALRLTSPRQGELLDFFGGMLDLRSRQVRVLHANSFIEDPTRIYRAVRFAVRLGFDIEPQTESYIRYGIESGVYERLRLEKQVAPALTTRLKAELKVILASSYWQVALKLLADLGALKCLHGQCQLDKALWWQLRCGSRWLKFLDPDHQTEHWLGRLVILLASLPGQDGAVIAAHLQLPQTHIELLRHFPTDEARIHHQLAHAQLPSQVFLALRPYTLTLLVAIAARSPKIYRR
ncbi:MAG: poly(A) polymerase, partial [Microcystaceae cyanobacterium]